MSNKTRRTRDAFTFSLGGLTTIASFVPAPVVADDTFREVRGTTKGRKSRDRNAASLQCDRDCQSAA